MLQEFQNISFFAFTYRLKIKTKYISKEINVHLGKNIYWDPCKDFEMSFNIFFFQLRSLMKITLFPPNLFAWLVFSSTKFSWKTPDIIHLYHKFSISGCSCLGWLLMRNNWELHALSWSGTENLKYCWNYPYFWVSVHVKAYISQGLCTYGLLSLPLLSKRTDVKCFCWNKNLS